MKNLKSSKVKELSLNEKKSIEGGGGFEDFLTAVADAIREYVYEKTGYCME